MTQLDVAVLNTIGLQTIVFVTSTFDAWLKKMDDGVHMRTGRILIPALVSFVARAQHSELGFYAPRFIYPASTLRSRHYCKRCVRFSPAADIRGITKAEFRPHPGRPVRPNISSKKVWSVIQGYSTILTAKQ